MEDKSILYIDDTESELELFGGLISEITKNVSLFHYKKESVEELVKKIVSEKPDIVLLDYNLSPTLKGNEVCKKLREENFSGMIIGFSNVSVDDRFMEAGADNFVLKNSYNPTKTMSELIKSIS